MSITEIEIIKNMVLSKNHQIALGSKNDARSQSLSINKKGGARNSTQGSQCSKTAESVESANTTQLFQTIQIQVNTYLRELRQQMISSIQNMMETQVNEATFDSGAFGKFYLKVDTRQLYLLRNGSNNNLQKLMAMSEEDQRGNGILLDKITPQNYNFDFLRVTQKNGSDEKQIMDVLDKFLVMAVKLADKCPNKKIRLDIKVGKIQLNSSQNEGQQMARKMVFTQDSQVFEFAQFSCQQDFYDTVLPTRTTDERNKTVGLIAPNGSNVTRQNLSQTFGNFKRNPMDVLSLRHSLHTNYRKRKIIDSMLNRTSIGQLDLSQFKYDANGNEVTIEEPIINLNRRRMKAKIDSMLQNPNMKLESSSPMQNKNRNSVDVQAIFKTQQPQQSVAAPPSAVTAATSTLNNAIQKQTQNSSRSQTSYINTREKSKDRFTSSRGAALSQPPENVRDFSGNQNTINPQFRKADQSMRMQNDPFMNKPRTMLPKSQDEYGTNLVRMIQKVQRKNKRVQLDATPLNSDFPEGAKYIHMTQSLTPKVSHVERKYRQQIPSTVVQRRNKATLDMLNREKSTYRDSDNLDASYVSPKIKFERSGKKGEHSDYVSQICPSQINTERELFEKSIKQLHKNRNESFDKDMLQSNMGALLCHNFINTSVERINNGNGQTYPNVPWHLRRNPISGMQYTQHMRSCSNDLDFTLQNTPKHNEEKNKFSFNKFVLQSQPEAWAYPTEKSIRDRHNSMLVVENALAEYKGKLNDRQEQERQDIKQHYTDIRNSNLLHLAQQNTIKDQNLKTQGFLDLQVSQEKTRKTQQIMERREMVNTCFVSHDFEQKYFNQKQIDQKKLQDHLNCEEAYNTDNQRRNQEASDERMYHNNIERAAHKALNKDEMMAENMRKRGLQEMHKRIWNDQKNMSKEKNRQNQYGYFE